jgi:hypothetical protein
MGWWRSRLPGEASEIGDFITRGMADAAGKQVVNFKKEA